MVSSVTTESTPFVVSVAYATLSNKVSDRYNLTDNGTNIYTSCLYYVHIETN